MSNVPRMDQVKRLQVIAAALPGSVLVTREMALEFDRVWRFIEDMEASAPLYERAISATRFKQRDDRRILNVRYSDGQQEVFEVRLGRGWCLMQSETFVAAFAATATENGTLLAHLEHWRLPGRLPVSPHKIDGELVEIERLITARQG